MSNGTEMMLSLIEEQQFLENINNELYAIEKGLIIKEHFSIIKEDKEMFLENLEEQYVAMLNKIKELIHRFTLWIKEKFKRFVNKLILKNKALAKFEFDENSSRTIAVPYDLKESLLNIIAVNNKFTIEISNIEELLSGLMVKYTVESKIKDVSGKIKKSHEKLKLINKTLKKGSKTVYNVNSVIDLYKTYDKTVDYMATTSDYLVNRTLKKINQNYEQLKHIRVIKGKELRQELYNITSVLGMYINIVMSTQAQIVSNSIPIFSDTEKVLKAYSK